MKCGRPNRRRLLVPALVLAIGATAALFFGCGRMPPVGFWEPSGADTTAIRSAIEGNATLLKASFNAPKMQLADLVIPESVISKAIDDNPFKQRFRCDSFMQVFNYDAAAGYVFGTSFIATLDTFHDSVMVSGPPAEQWAETTWIETTATVTVVETIPGTVKLHAFRYTRFIKDSVFETSPGETVRLKYYDTTWTDTSMYVEKPLAASVTSGCVLRKEAGSWVLWKLGGGLRFTAPTPEDAPYLVSFQLASTDRTDTISLRPDTLHYGVQRFYVAQDSGSQLLSFALGDSARVPIISGYSTDVMNFLNWSGDTLARRRWQPTARAYFTTPGIHRLYLQQIPFTVFFDLEGELTSLVWGIPLKVRPGGAQ